MLGDAGFCGICELGGAACESGSIDQWVRPGYIAGYAKRVVKNPIPSPSCSITDDVVEIVIDATAAPPPAFVRIYNRHNSARITAVTHTTRTTMIGAL